MAEIIVISNHKGGVAKTTTTLNLGNSLGKMGYKVLTVDGDPQASLTGCYGLTDMDVEIGLNDLIDSLIEGEELPDSEKYIYHSKYVDFIPTKSGLSETEKQMNLEMKKEEFYSDILEPVVDMYDYILLDTCCAINVLTINAFFVADKVVIPVTPEYLSAKGLNDLLKKIIQMKRRLNRGLEIGGILITKYDKRIGQCRNTYRDIQNIFGEKIPIYQAIIPCHAVVGDAIHEGVPLSDFAPKAPACIAYNEFAMEVLA